MHSALNAFLFPEATPVESQLAATAAAGFEGIELVVTAGGALRPETPLDDLRGLGRRAADLGLQITSITTPLFWQTNYGLADDAGRRQARELTIRLLDFAAACNAEAIVIVPAVVGRATEPRMQLAYCDALNRTYDALSVLRHEAEARAVTIALENVWNRFLLSPVELADLIDRVDSPHVGVCFDTGNVLAFGYPQDWIQSLGRRIARVHAKDYDVTQPGRTGFCLLGEGSVDWPAVLAALRETHYDGPLIFEGAGAPDEAARRLRRILEL